MKQGSLQLKLNSQKDTWKSEGVEGRVNNDHDDRASFFLMAAALRLMKDAPERGWHHGIPPRAQLQPSFWQLRH